MSAAATAPEDVAGPADFDVEHGAGHAGVAGAASDAGESRLLVARFPLPVQVASWAIWNGGRRRVPAVAWVGVTNAELPLGADPRALCEARLRAAGLSGAVGLLTSGQLARYRRAAAAAEGVRAQALATVGLSNALRVGDEPGAMQPAGTINILCAVSVPLSEEAALEALSIAVEARTAAVLEARHPSRRSGAPSSGTGTDCVVVAWPDPTTAASAAVFAAKHTALGHVIGRAVGDSVRAGVADWLEARACR